LSWHVDDDILLYYTWSQGFRPGGFNRGVKFTQMTPSRRLPVRDADPVSPGHVDQQRTRLQDRILEPSHPINGAVYREDWKNTIVEFFDPQQGFGNLTFVTNGPNYRVDGFELQFITKVTEGLTVQGSGSYNHSYQANSPSLINNNPASPNFGKPITSVENVFGLQGSPLGESPRLQGNARVRYEFPMFDYHAFGQVGGQYYGRSNSTSAPWTTTSCRATPPSMRRRVWPRTRGTCSSSCRMPATRLPAPTPTRLSSS
jgi:iron complex outermembrane receptor protein